MRVNYAGWPDQNGDIEVPDIPEGMVSPWWSGLAWEEREPTDVERAIAAANKRAQRVMVVSMRQAELALLDAGLLDDVELLVMNLPRAAQIEWKRAQSVERDHPLIAYVQQAKGLTDEQIDDLFTDAARR